MSVTRNNVLTTSGILMNRDLYIVALYDSTLCDATVVIFIRTITLFCLHCMSFRFKMCFLKSLVVQVLFIWIFICQPQQGVTSLTSHVLMPPVGYRINRAFITSIGLLPSGVAIVKYPDRHLISIAIT